MVPTPFPFPWQVFHHNYDCFDGISAWLHYFKRVHLPNRIVSLPLPKQSVLQKTPSAVTSIVRPFFFIDIQSFWSVNPPRHDTHPDSHPFPPYPCGSDTAYSNVGSASANPSEFEVDHARKGRSVDRVAGAFWLSTSRK